MFSIHDNKINYNLWRSTSRGTSSPSAGGLGGGGCLSYSSMIFISLTITQMNIVQVKACLCYIIKDFNTNPLSASSIVLLPINIIYVCMLEPPSTILHGTLLDYSHILSLILIISLYPSFTEGEKKQLSHDIQNINSLGNSYWWIN